MWPEQSKGVRGDSTRKELTSKQKNARPKHREALPLVFCPHMRPFYSSKVTLLLPKGEVYCQVTLIFPNGPNGKILWKKPSHHRYIRIPTDDFTTVNYASGGSTPSTCLPGSDII